MHHILQSFDFYHDYRQGLIDRQTFFNQLMKHRYRLMWLGLSEREVHDAARLPANEEAYVDAILWDLRVKGFLTETDYNHIAFAKYRATVETQYDHGDYATWIFPEEERLVYALTQILQPRSVIVLGAYYGYWGVWTMPAIFESAGKALFIDPDPFACEATERNLKQLGVASRATVVVEDAITFLERNHDQYDFALLDAQGPSNHPNPDYRGKAIYYPIIQGSHKRLVPGGTIVCHNIMLSNHLTDPFIQNVINNYLREYDRFLPFVQNSFSKRADYATTQGIGLYQVC